jgi:hypothetical protein
MPGEPQARQIEIGSKVKIRDTHTKIWNFEGIEGLVESTSPLAGPPDPANATVCIPMTNGRYEGRAIIDLDVLNVTLIETATADS